MNAISKSPAVSNPTLFGALKNVGNALYNLTARFSNYAAAQPTTTTRTSSYNGTNANSTVSSMQRVGMNWTAEDVYKNSCIGAAYINTRINYCSSQMTYLPNTGDAALDQRIKVYLQGDDGCGGVFSTMGVDCSMQDAFSRTADIETPVRGDAGLIFWRDDFGNIRLIEFSADQLGWVYDFTLPRICGLAYDNITKQIVETSGGDCVYFAGRYFRGCDCVAYKILERTNSWYANPKIYPASDVVYFRDPSSFRGIRGVTKFATAIQHMEKGEALFQIGMNAAMRQAQTAMIVKNGRGAPDEPSYEPIVGDDGLVTYATRTAGGPNVEYFYTGDDAAFVSPDSPGTELIQGCEFSDERVALALGVNYASLISATKVGGAPSRLEINKFTKEMQRIQNNIHRPRANRIKDVTLLDAAQKGILPMHPGLLAGRWQFPISATVDAGYSAKENIDNLRAGLETPQDLCAETNRDWETVRMLKKQAAIQIAKDTQDANRELETLGYDGTIAKEDLAQLSDNPQQTAIGNEIETGKVSVSSTGKTQDKQTAKLSAYIGDVNIGDLPASVQLDISKILGVTTRTDNLKAIKYGMVASELESMADSHNLESAQNHIRYSTNGSCADEVHANDSKHILTMNGRIVDGHHHLAKALKGKVTKSLQVIDLTPTRFQHSTAKLSSNEGGEWRTVNGRHILIKDGQSVEDAMKENTQVEHPDLQSKLDDESSHEDRRIVAEEWLDANPEKRSEFYSKLKSEAARGGHTLEAYHGTNSDFSEFDKSKSGSATSGPGSNDAIFVTEDRSHALERGSIAMPVFVNPGKTLVVDKLTDTFDAGEIIKKAKAEGKYQSVKFEKLDDADGDSNGRTSWAIIGDHKESRVKSGREIEFNKQGKILPITSRFN